MGCISDFTSEYRREGTCTSCENYDYEPEEANEEDEDDGRFTSCSRCGQSKPVRDFKLNEDSYAICKTCWDDIDDYPPF
jgi:hypothetical protein